MSHRTKQAQQSPTFRSAALALALLLPWLAPSVAWFDSGELAAAAVQLGVPHPTGFALFDLFGHAFARLPLGPAAWRVHLMGATAAVTGVWLWQRALALPGARHLAADTALLLLPLLAPAVLLHVRATEVYPLVWLVAGIAAWLWTCTASGRRVVALGLLTGVGAGVHVEAALLAGLGFVAATVVLLRARGPLVWRPPLLAVGLGLLGAASVTYLPLSAARSPALSWGDLTTLPALLDHLSAASIRAAFADRIGGVREGLPALAHLIWRDAAWLVLPAAWGARRLWQVDRRAFAATLALVIVDCAYSAALNPMGLRDDQAGGVALLGLGVLAGVAAQDGIARLRGGTGTNTALWLLCSAVLALGVRDLDRAPQADLVAGGRMADLLWRDVPPGALLVAGSDHRASACLWTQTAEGVRPDALCVPGAFLRDRRMLAWYARTTGRPGFAQAAAGTGEIPSVLADILRPALKGGGVLWQPGYADLDAQVAGHVRAGVPWLRVDSGVISMVQRAADGEALLLAVAATCTDLDCPHAPTLAAAMAIDLALAGTWWLRTDAQLAWRMVAQAAALAPDCAPVLNNFAVLESERGRPAHALELAERALSVQPDYVRAHRTAARAAVRLAQADAAVTHAERYLAARRRDREAMLWLRDLVADAPAALRPRLTELAR